MGCRIPSDSIPTAKMYADGGAEAVVGEASRAGIGGASVLVDTPGARTPRGVDVTPARPLRANIWGGAAT
jgi:hypothetical protein